MLYLVSLAVSNSFGFPSKGRIREYGQRSSNSELRLRFAAGGKVGCVGFASTVHLRLSVVICRAHIHSQIHGSYILRHTVHAGTPM